MTTSPSRPAMNTAFVNRRNPWTGQHVTKTNKPISPAQHIDLGDLSICSDPIPEHRKLVGSKYDELFAKLKPGEAIKCPPGAAPARIATSLRKYLERNKIAADIRTCADYGDGKGRVWLLNKPKAAANSSMRSAA